MSQLKYRCGVSSARSVLRFSRKQISLTSPLGRHGRTLGTAVCCELTATETKSFLAATSKSPTGEAANQDLSTSGASTLTPRRVTPSADLIAVSPTTASMDGLDCQIPELSPDSFYPFLAGVGQDKLVVIDFYTDWCGPCKIMSKELEKLAAIFPSVTFAKFNCGKWDGGFVTQQRIRSLPTLRFYCNSQALDEVKGVRIVELKQLLLVHSNRVRSLLQRSLSMEQRASGSRSPSSTSSLDDF